MKNPPAPIKAIKWDYSKSVTENKIELLSVYAENLENHTHWLSMEFIELNGRFETLRALTIASWLIAAIVFIGFALILATVPHKMF